MMFYLDPENDGFLIVITEQKRPAVVPMKNGNRYYEAYLEWVAEGNTAKEWQPEEFV